MEQNCHSVSLGGGKSNLLTVLLSRTRRISQNLLAVQVFIADSDESFENVFVSLCARPDVRSVHSGSGTRSSFVGAPSDSRFARVERTVRAGKHLPSVSVTSSLARKGLRYRRLWNYAQIFGKLMTVLSESSMQRRHREETCGESDHRRQYPHC